MGHVRVAEQTKYGMDQPVLVHQKHIKLVEFVGLVTQDPPIMVLTVFAMLDFMGTEIFVRHVILLVVNAQDQEQMNVPLALTFHIP